MLNKCKINSLAVTNQVTVGRLLQCVYSKYTEMSRYMLNKELSSVSHKIMTKPYSIEEKKTNKRKFKHHYIIITVLISTFLLLYGLNDLL